MSISRETEQNGRYACIICGPSHRRGDLVPLATIREPILAMIRADRGEFPAEARICRDHLNTYRDLYIRRAIEADKGQLDELETEVLRSLKENDILAENAEEVFEGELTFGKRLWDSIASFGGSWKFIIAFGVVLAGWIALNIVGLLA
ncbi:hypothetical protein [Parvibaculum sp.]|uniref:hypothetical protein n=1 Tax=Parvibaculum sp. TaxID=2024848 RepID=UPI00391C09DA